MAFRFAAVSALFDLVERDAVCAASRAGSTRTWYCFCSPPVAMTCDTPGTASSRRRTTVSAAVRSSSGECRSDSRATNRISPMIDETGARNGGSTSGGSAPATSVSFSVTIWRARCDVLSPVELDPDDRDADGRRRAHAAHARRAVQRRLDRERDQRLDLRRGHARRFGQDRDGRRGEIGQHVQRHARRRPAAPDQEGGGQRDDDRRDAQRPANQSVDHAALAQCTCPCAGTGVDSDASRTR